MMSVGLLSASIGILAGVLAPCLHGQARKGISINQDTNAEREQRRQELLRARPNAAKRIVYRVPATDKGITNILEQQRQAFVAERAKIMATASLQVKNLPAGQTQALTTGVGNYTVNTPAGTQPTPANNSANTKYVKKVNSFPTAAATPPSALPSAAARNAATSPALCQTPIIYTVNNRSQDVVFTPQQQYNRFTIRGCKFGELQGEAHIYGHFKSVNIPLRIEYWTDTAIVAAVDPGVSGEVDQDDVNLVVRTVASGQVQKGACKFYAARETVLLKSIPSSNVQFEKDSRTPGVSQFVSPVTDTPDWTLHVLRSSNSNYPFAYGGGDAFRIGPLAPGFVVQELDLGYVEMTEAQCKQKTLNGNFSKNGNWFTELDNSRKFSLATVFFGDQLCVDQGDGQAGSFRFEPQSYSNYWLAVYVTGPKGVQPW
jgi:hypothetical protein